MARRWNREEMVCADTVAVLFSVDAHRSLAGIRPSEDLGAIASKTASFSAVSHDAMALDAGGRHPPGHALQNSTQSEICDMVRSRNVK